MHILQKKVTLTLNKTYLYMKKIKDKIESISMDASDVAELLSDAADGLYFDENEAEETSEMSLQDRKFMDKLMELMEKNMDNGDLVVDDLVHELAVSRSVFFKKLKTLTGMAPIEFIKEMRVKRAAQLIETGDYSMTQIAYMVGINDPRYFSKCFKQHYGMTPTEYKDTKNKTKK